MAGSIYDKKSRIRPPRVHISYDVELNGAQVKKELPFVVGVLADFSGNPAEPLPRPRDRKFVEIDRDNFDDILKSTKPRAAFKVANTLQDDGSELSVELEFQKLGDFAPDAVARQVKPLNDLLEIRTRLKALLSKTEGNDRLEELLNEIVKNPELRDKLKDAMKIDESGTGGEGA
jgi:type VI secretion system protein ImpB